MSRFYGKLSLRLYLHNCSTGRPRIDFRDWDIKKKTNQEIKTDIRTNGRSWEWDMVIDLWLTDSERKQVLKYIENFLNISCNKINLNDWQISWTQTFICYPVKQHRCKYHRYFRNLRTRKKFYIQRIFMHIVLRNRKKM